MKMTHSFFFKPPFFLLYYLYIYQEEITAIQLLKKFNYATHYFYKILQKLEKEGLIDTEYRGKYKFVRISKKGQKICPIIYQICKTLPKYIENLDVFRGT